MPWRERETRFEGDENRKRGERADGGVSGWKKRARTERSRRRRRRRRRRPMKKSLVAPAGLANILLSNTRATHTPSPFASPLARPLSVPFLSRGQWRRKRGNERRKAWSWEGREVRGNVAEGLRWPDARWKRPQGSFRRDDAGCITGFQRTFVRYFRDRHSKRHVFFFSFFFLKREISLNSILSLFLSRVIFGELYFEVCVYI